MESISIGTPTLGQILRQWRREMQRSILVLVTVASIGCASGLTHSGRPANGGLAYLMTAERAEATCEEAIQQAKPGTKYKKLEGAIGFKMLTLSMVDWAYHFVRAEPWPTADGIDAYAFYSGWRGASRNNADVRQELVDELLYRLLAEENPADMR
jgi:hypothetical protein